MTPTQSETSTAVREPSSKTLQVLRKRLRQLCRITLVLAIGLAVATVAIFVWRLNSLNGLPDIGDPFDVAAFRAFRIPDEENAFTFLRRAEEKLTPSPNSRLERPWSEADPKLREWVKANRQAIELFQRGADQLDAANPDGDSVATGQRAAMLVVLEAGRREASGDMAGAWACYRAILRMATHVRRRGSMAQRADLYADWEMRDRKRLATWAADPRTTISQLHGALEDAQECEPKPEWDSFALKVGYLAMTRRLEQPVPPFLQQDLGWEYRLSLGDMELSPAMAGNLDAACRFLLREPERSRRVLRLLYANWLAHAERRDREPQKPAARVVFSVLKLTNPMRWGKTWVSLYPAGPLAPAGERLMPAYELARWLAATNDLKLRILIANDIHWPWSPESLRDRKDYRELVVMLAEEIYRRERGSLPPSEDALVGGYLKSLPDDGAADLDDGTAPVVE
jgi:hypothetical protein